MIKLDRTWRRILVGVVVAILMAVAGSERHARRLLKAKWLQAVEARQQLDRRFAEISAAHEQLTGDLATERSRSQALEEALASAKRELEQTTGRLAEVVRRGVAARGWQRIDPATRTFQALRIWVNRELEGLDHALQEIAGRLRA